MATNWETFPIQFTGGLITNKGRVEQGISAPGSATILQNFEPDVLGGYTRILGYTKFSSTGVTGTGQIQGVVGISSAEVLAVRDGEWFYSTGTSWTNKATLADPDILKIKYDTYNFAGITKTVIVDGVNDPVFFDHDAKTMTYMTAAPAEVTGSTSVKLFKSSLFYGQGRNLSFTVPYTEEDFSTGTGGGVINVGDDIIGLAVFRDQLIIFCLSRIFKLTGNSSEDYVLSSITDNTGCICGHTIQEVGGDIMYLGPDGVRWLSASERENDFGLSRASENIQKEILRITSTNCIYTSVTVANKNQYRLFTFIDSVEAASSKGFLSTSYANQTSSNNSWSTLKGFKVYDVSKVQARDREYIFFASDTDYVYRMESGNSFDGADIEAIFETPYMPISDPKKRKTIFKHSLYAQPRGNMNLTCTLRFDYSSNLGGQPSSFQITGGGGVAVYGDPLTVYGVAVYGYSSEEQYYSNTIGSGFVVALNYYNNSQEPPFNLNFGIIEYRENERR